MITANRSPLIPAAPGTRLAGAATAPLPRCARRPALALLLCALTLLTAACTPSPKDTAATTGPSAAPATSTAPLSSAPATVTSSPATSSSHPSVRPSSATPVPSKPSSVPATSAPAGPIDGPDGCPTASLSVAALRASGAAGHQYAFLQFTNKSAKTCSLTGYPGVQLVKAGVPMGRPAVRTGKAVTKVRLAPGHSATAQLVDASTCEAANSDSVAIYPPNRTERLVVPLSVRGCALSIDPVIPG